jgi:spore maturation protein SpmA
VLNWIWLGLIVFSVVAAAFTGRMDQITPALFEGAKSAITLVIGIVGGMCFMLGIMRVAFDGGLRDFIARALAPLLKKLFPEVPADHPAMGAMVMNMACNMMGLGNAATPFGLKAMVELAKLNPHPGSASNAMVLFLAINTSAITLMAPTGTIVTRYAAGSSQPEAIWVPTLIATTCSTLAAISMYFLLLRRPAFRHRPVDPQSAAAPEVDEAILQQAEVEIPVTPTHGPLGLGRRLFVWAVCLATCAALVLNAVELSETMGAWEIVKTVLQVWLFPLLIGGLVLIGVTGGINVYDSMIAGAREGLDVGVRIVPYLVAILAAVAMFRASGALEFLISVLDPVTSPLGVPAEVLPMAILRPFSGSGAFAIMSETLTTYGADSFIGMLSSTLMGSTETTFYVLAIYFGAARIVEGRHTLAACLTGDLAGFAGAVAACHLFFG